MGEEKTRITNLNEMLAQYRGDGERMKSYLITISGENIGKIYPIEGEIIKVGRGGDCQIQIIESSISREHASIQLDGRGVPILKDLASTNGTFVNGFKIREAVLNDGDKIQFGVTTVLKFAYQDSLETQFQMNLYESSVKDPLTGIFNRRYFIDRLGREFSYALRHIHNLGLFLIDIDHFKSVNDTYGHIAGDAVLKEMTKRISARLRNEDVFCRYGGEEFALILRNCSSDHLVIIADRIRKLFDGIPVYHNGTAIPITISIGVASMNDESIASGEDLVTVADRNLYRAKNDGRNCVRS